MGGIFVGAAALMTELSMAFRLGDCKGDLAVRIERLAQGAESLIRADCDAGLAGIRLVHKHGYAVAHSVHAALLVEALAQSLSWAAQRRRSLVAAALTMNLAIRDLQDELWTWKGEVDAQRWAQLLGHPTEGARQLREAGIRDPLWLQIVARHHERIDGSGYPAGLRGADLPVEVRVVALADLYCALAVSRDFRTALVGGELQEAFLARAATVDRALGAFVLRWIGVYAPGTGVVLADGETAVVVRRPGKGVPAHCPRVRAIQRVTGDYHHEPPWRQTDREATRIVRALHSIPRRLPYPVEDLWCPLGRFKESPAAAE
ncbi:MAG: hypothetical protein B7Z66_11645 [Chromatiales bacterium 21-64-14]|nr:MAG: hypothetical protein B7Z66_11645 [Chromatiales bacterium 21-64-14]